MLTPPAVPPLGVAELGETLARLARFEAAPLIAVAVSGGPDSLALTILADRWARARGGEACALSVDHRLRPESGAELRRVGGWLSARGICHQILVWHGERPVSGLQEAARAARYRLLAQWCRDRGYLHLLTAHHREDQAETHQIRRAAGSGADGLAGMPAVRELDGCRILRPLLGIGKARLIATLEAERQPFIADPSNHDPAFARGRLRRGAMSAMPAAELDQLLDTVARLGRMRAARERAGDALLARAVAVHPAGFAALDPALLLAAPSGIAEPAISALVVTLGGRLYPPRRRQVARLLRVLAGAAEGGRTLGGCCFVGWRGRLLVLRELAAAAAPGRVAPGASLLWDRRFAVAAPQDAPGSFAVGYLGREGVAELVRRVPRLRHARLPPLVRPILPALRDEHGIAAVPHLRYRREGVAVLPKLAFRPVKSLSDAGFAVA
ncbi:MAG TPA: tRNA lysidine(34) synthetase TilS [Stellaceae bacterium]